MSKMINEFTLTHLQPVFASPRNNAMIVLRIKLRCCMRLDLDHSPLYTFYNMNGLGWEPRQKVDCISSGYFYPVFAFISTRDIPILLGDENNILSLEPDLGMLTSPCPGDCCWTHNIYPVWCPLLSSARVDRMQLFIVPRSVLVTRTSSGPWHSWHGVTTVSRKCEDVMLSWIRPTPVMSTRVTTLHPLVTSANINTDMIQHKILPPFQIFISECVSTRFLLLLAGKMFVWTTVFLFTLYLALVVSTIPT